MLFPQAGFIPIPAPTTAATGSSWFRIDAGSRCFDGHFDGAPILPGVAHVALALSACSQNLGTLIGVRDLRFSKPLGPGDEVEVLLNSGKDPSSIRFEIRCRAETSSSGLLLFRQ